MKKKIVLLITLTSVSCIATAQNAKDAYFDSLKRVLVIAQQDTSPLATLQEIAFGLTNTNTDSAIHYAEQALTIVRKLKDLKSEATVLVFRGYESRLLGVVKAHEVN